MYEIYVAARFEAAHRLVGDFGPATRTHGHTYRMEVILRGQHLGDDGTLYDIGELGQAVEGLADSMHYRDLNEVPGLAGSQHDGRGGGLLLLGEAGRTPPRPGARLAYGTHLGVPRRLRSPRRRAGLRDVLLRVAFITVGDTGRKTGGYLYNGRVISGLAPEGVRDRGGRGRRSIARGATKAALRFGSTFDPSRFDAIVVDALARIAGRTAPGSLAGPATCSGAGPRTA